MDPVFGTIASAASGLASGIGGIFASMRNTDKTNQANKDIANQNIDFQRENLDYQKALQQQIFEREDSAYERTVNDMRTAGLSPLAMTGTDGAGQPIQTDAIHNDYQQQGYDLSAIATIAQSLSNLAYTSAETDKLRSEARKANAEADKVIFGNNIDEFFGKDLARINHDSAYLDLVRKEYDTSYQTSNGITDSMSPEERKMAYLVNGLGLQDMNFDYLTKGASSKDFNELGNNIGGLFLMSGFVDILKSLVPDIKLSGIYKKLKVPKGN